jgi:hypothetical protein
MQGTSSAIRWPQSAPRRTDAAHRSGRCATQRRMSHGSPDRPHVRLVNDLLDVSRITSGRIILNVQAVDPSPGIADASTPASADSTRGASISR